MKMCEKKYKSRLSMVLFFLEGCYGWFALAILFGALMQLLVLANPRIIGFTVDSVIGVKATDLPWYLNSLVEVAGGISALRENLLIVAVAVVLVALCSAVAKYAFRVTNARGSEKLVKRMRDTLFDHLEHLPFSWFGENHTGDIIQRCTSDVETIKVFLSEQLSSLVRIVIMIVLALYFMFGIHPVLAVCSAVFIPVIVAYSVVFHSKIGKAFRHADEEEGKLSAIAQENLTGVRVVRAFGREDYEKERFEKQNRSYTDMWIHLIRLLSAFWCSGDLISGLQILTVTTLGAIFCVRGEMTAGNYIAFVSYNAILQWPVRGIGRVIAQMSKAGISIDRLAYIMNSEIEEDSEDAVEPDMNGDIVFDHVTFGYDNGTGDILEDVSFTVKQGTTFGILGSTGSGKSTLMYLLDRLYDLKEGQGTITVNGTDIREIKREYLRRNIGMVLQEPYLFSRSLQENIRIASQNSNLEDVRRAAGAASLDDAVMHFKEGYDTYVGERGVTLSGGQKQRTAIAQMLIRKPPVMVFDDSLSAVDSETDAKIRQALKGDTSGSTVILIAHRITTLMDADCILVLNKGKVVQMGNHEELLGQDGIYKEICNLQMCRD